MLRMPSRRPGPELQGPKPRLQPATRLVVYRAKKSTKSRKSILSNGLGIEYCQKDSTPHMDNMLTELEQLFEEFHRDILRHEEEFLDVDIRPTVRVAATFDE